MLNACNTEASSEPIDLALLDIPRHQIEESPEDMLAALDAQPPQQTPTTPLGILMMLLPDRRSRRLSWCRSYWQWYTDGHHKWCRTSTPCDLVIACLPCAMYQAKEQQLKYDGLYPHIPDAGFTRLSFPLDLSEPKKTYDRLFRHLKRYLPKAPTLGKIKPASDRIEVLYCAPTTPDSLARLHKLYPDMRAVSCQRSQFRDELANVLRPDLPKDPEAIAALDAKYLKVRLLRFHGLSQEDRKKLSPIEPESIVDNYHEDKTKSCHCGEHGKLTPLPKCPKCGKLPTKFSRWQSRMAKEPPPDQWIDVVLYVPTDPPLHIE